MIEILHACPANCVTGGPECIHEFVSKLNKIDGVRARVWYWNVGAEDPCPDEYKFYNCDYVTQLPDGFKGVVIVPEIWADRVMDFKDCIRAIYWLGIDSYSKWAQPGETGAFLKDKDIIHIVQSEYAFDFLERLGVKRIVECTDTVNREFYEKYEESDRSDAILYNPAKATPFMKELIDACDGLRFKPIQGMSRQEVIDTMRKSKLYVDFGEFPGRERMPREAALCGCCLITSKVGAAAYDEDFAHDYKFDSKSCHIWAIIHKIKTVLNDYDGCRKDFERFRRDLKNDIDKVDRQCREVINEIQHYYPGI